MAKKRKPYVPEPRPAWTKPARPVAGIFGPHRDFPITTKELATLRRVQLDLFSTESTDELDRPRSP